MPRTTCSASLVIITTLITTGYASGIVVANAAAPAAGDACSLLTKKDAAAALGESVSGPKSTPNLSAGPGMTASGCGYSGSGLHTVNLNLFHLSPASAMLLAGTTMNTESCKCSRARRSSLLSFARAETPPRLSKASRGRSSVG
jgi:hypothetical protein